jgi:hypothetical protein
MLNNATLSGVAAISANATPSPGATITGVQFQVSYFGTPMNFGGLLTGSGTPIPIRRRYH